MMSLLETLLGLGTWSLFLFLFLPIGVDNQRIWWGIVNVGLNPA